MATLLLGTVGGLVGGALFGPAGALLGRAAGALGGAVLDRAMFSTSRRVEGPRLSDLSVMSSTEGAPMPRLYGRARLAGQVIWAMPFEEVVSTGTQSSGGKGGGGGAGGSVTTTTYSYFASFAVGLCEAEATRIGRIRADGQLLDTQGLTVRAHLGGADQEPDPLIEAVQGAEGTPAYRGLAYVVFERLPLADYGNRLPQIAVEVERAVGALETRLRAVTLIPGATEFGYDTQIVRRVEGAGVYEAENRHVTTADTDFEASLDQLLAACPNLESVALVVAWFGTDLRAGACQVRPGVDRRDKQTSGPGGTVNWRVSGQTRSTAYLVSTHEGRPSFAGTPSDESVRRAIQMLKARGLKVTLYPFIMMDVPAANSRADPWSGAASQPAYPWRGRITCHPAPGRPGSPDGTAAAGTQVAALFGTCLPGHFGASGGQVTYSGPSEWSLRRMALHYARLSVIAGGVEAILIGSEMEALTRVRSAPGVYPAAEALAALAADVKSVVGPSTAVSYAANWTEYGAHVPSDGEVRFPLDVLWGAEAVDFVAIDWYPPLADWRDGESHLDAAAHASTHDPAYLAANMRGGEAFDWYYADDDARAAQARLPIADGAYAEPWVFRQKDLAGWWGNAHHARIGGVRQAGATDWVPGSKPVRLTETGCAAVDKGANRPSSFPDPKSSETGYPPFSNRRRDDLMQRRFLEAMLDGLDDPDFNPPAALPSGRMLADDAVHAWSWDARPYPAFPVATDVWADGANWETGHWLNGRLGGAPLAGLAARLADDFGVELDAAALRGVVDGYVVDRPMSARAALEPLGRAFGFDLTERDGALALRPRGGPAAVEVTDEVLVRGEGAELRLVRGAESELPRAVTLGFIDGASDYRQASAASRRLAGGARTQTGAELALVTSDAVAEAAAEVWLQDFWATRDTATFALPPSFLALEPGDVVRLVRDGRERLFEITAIEDTQVRAVTARSIDPNVFDVTVRAARPGSAELPPASGPPEALALALPALGGGDPVALAHIAAFASPWPGALALWRSVDGASFERVATLPAPAVMGATVSVLPPGLPWRWQRGVVLDVRLHGGLIAAASEAAVLGGANAYALVGGDGRLEVVQTAEAELVGVRTWRLSGLLRGQLGTEAACREDWPEGTALVRIDANLAVAVAGLDLLGRTATFRIGRADRDHGDIDVTELTAGVDPRALRPFAPVHARARRGAGGVTLSWVRRTRTDGDSWDMVEVPLGEAAEAYRVEILDGGTVVRSYEVSAPTVLYSAAAELADFGAPQAELTLRIAQLSAVVGPGHPLEATVRVG